MNLEDITLAVDDFLNAELSIKVIFNSENFQSD